MVTKVIDDEYARKHFPEIVGKTLIPRYWNHKDEDSIWVDCVENPKLSGWIYYAFLENWRIDG